MGALYNYPYLCGVLALLGICAVELAICQELRRPMLICALLSTPFSLASIACVPEYWNPAMVLPFLPGVEDIIFSFTTGGIAWFSGIWPLRRQITVDFHPTRIICRYLSVMSLGTVLFCLFRLSGLGVMSAILVSGLAAGAVTIVVGLPRPMYAISVPGVVGFTIPYTLLLSVLTRIAPQSRLQWNSDNLWGPSVLGIP